MHGWIVNTGAIRSKIVPSKYRELGNKVTNRTVYSEKLCVGRKIRIWKKVCKYYVNKK